MTKLSIRDELSCLSAKDAAKRLIGAELISSIDGGSAAGIVVETEAYDQSDMASHTYRGPTKRNLVMFGPAGITYVYFTYGMHYCMNVVVGEEGMGAAVLIRALEPLDGIELMSARRKTDRINNLLNGPAKICQALGVDRRLNGHDLTRSPLRLRLNPEMPEAEIAWTERIGIREEKGGGLVWRACLRKSEFLSRPLFS